MSRREAAPSPPEILTGVDPADAKQIEQRMFDVEQVSRWFGIPRHAAKAFLARRGRSMRF